MAVLAMVTSLLPAGAAHASISSPDPDGEVNTPGGCLVKICGSVMNESNHVVWAIKDFNSNGPAPGTTWRPLQPREQTPPNEDWDGFYVQCNASGRIARWTPPGVWVWRDFSLPAKWWMKIRTDEDAHVRNQSC